MADTDDTELEPEPVEQATLNLYQTVQEIGDVILELREAGVSPDILFDLLRSLKFITRCHGEVVAEMHRLRQRGK
jgi:hypothetical protein